MPMRLRTQLILIFVGFLAIFSLGVGSLVYWQARQTESVTLQKVSANLAKHIIEHWPIVSQTEPSDTAKKEQAVLIDMLMTVNPGVQVYLLNAEGRVVTYLGDQTMVRQHQVALDPVRAFLANQSLPIRGTDPMDPAAQRLFSAAMFPQIEGQQSPPGYLYIVLDGAPRLQQSGFSSQWSVLTIAFILGGVAISALLWILIVRRLSDPLAQLANRMEAYEAQGERRRTDDSSPAQKRASVNEVTQLNEAFGRLQLRIEQNALLQKQQYEQQRETMAGIAHDLRTPLTALHGYLEAIQNAPKDRPNQSKPDLIEVAIQQSNKVRRLSKQLFELAALEIATELVRKETFNLDELISDTVQKFDSVYGTPNRITLEGEAPGRIEVNGDMELIERAITNLIENAHKHGESETTVSVSITQSSSEVKILVSDNGRGLPDHLVEQLERRQPLRPSIKLSKSGGLGGLGLSIAQRIAHLHGGYLLPVKRTSVGTSLCMAIPLTLNQVG